MFIRYYLSDPGFAREYTLCHWFSSLRERYLFIILVCIAFTQSSLTLVDKSIKFISVPHPQPVEIVRGLKMCEATVPFERKHETWHECSFRLCASIYI